MKTIGTAVILVAVVVANAFLVTRGRAQNDEEQALARGAASAVGGARQAEADSADRGELLALLSRADSYARDVDGIGSLRDALLRAESGLAIDRLSLDFRVEEGLPASLGGTRIHASLEGPYHAVWRYLDAVESQRLALSPETIVLRGDEGGVSVAAQWTARWLIDPSIAPESPAPEVVAGLESWLSRRSESRSTRDPFSRSPVGDTVVVSISETPEEAVPFAGATAETVAPGPILPELTGFILARPELEEDVRRRVLAALSYEGELHLVAEGDSIGEFVIARIAARESVTLEHGQDHTRIELTLR